MKSGFGHFDESTRETFCAAVILLVMDVDESAKAVVERIVRNALGIEEPCKLIEAGREAWLVTTDEQSDARVDLWLLVEGSTDRFLVFVEVKTHDNWPAHKVAQQVLDQASRPRLVAHPYRIHGCVLLAPTWLCERVRTLEPKVRCVPWKQLLGDWRGIKGSRLVEYAVHHLEAHVDRTTGIVDRKLGDFVQATTTVACLRQFLGACIAAIDGEAGRGLNMTPGDGQPLSDDDWAWFGMSMYFTLGKAKYRLGIYKYVETQAGEESAKDGLWLEAYRGNEQTPIACLTFNPPTLAPVELDVIRAQFSKAWGERPAEVQASFE